MEGAADNESTRLPARLLQDVVPRQPLLQQIPMSVSCAKGKPMTADQHYKDMTKKLTGLTGGKRMFEVFRDFTELFALSLRNVVDKRDWQEREDRYLAVAKGYTRDQLNLMAEVMAMVVMQMERNPEDVLGRLYMQLEVSNDARGQFFTPYEVAKLMASMQVERMPDDGKEFITIYEPACGAGAFMIAIAQELRQQQRQFHVTAEDIDPVAVHMAYIQFTLLDIPAVVFHRDTLSMETYDAWPTMAHVRDLWTYKLRRGAKQVEQVPVAEPISLADLQDAEQGAFDFVLEGA